MNKDFHLYATFLAAKLAGYSTIHAKEIAFAAQMVDDFDETHSKTCHTVTGMAGKMLEAWKDTYFSGNNSSALDISDTWMPFHFIPMRPIPVNMAGNTSEAFACGCGNPMAEVCEFMIPKNSEEQAALSLTRIGITMHVLADSFAHSGFAGITCYNPRIAEQISVEILDCREGLSASDHAPVAMSSLLQGTSYYGHGSAGHIPDLSWAKYYYGWKGGNQGSTFTRNNPNDFASAFEKMVHYLVRYRNHLPLAEAVSYRTEDVREYLERETERIQTEYRNIIFRNDAICYANGLIPGYIESKLSFAEPLITDEIEELANIREQMISVKSIVQGEETETDVKVGILIDESQGSLSFDVSSDKAFETFYTRNRNREWPSAEDLNKEYEMYRKLKSKDADYELQAARHKEAVYQAINMNYGRLKDLVEHEFEQAFRPISWNFGH